MGSRLDGLSQALQRRQRRDMPVSNVVANGLWCFGACKKPGGFYITYLRLDGLRACRSIAWHLASGGVLHHP